MTQREIEQAMQIAVQNQQAGKLGEAELIYRQILAGQPNHANALHLLGAIAIQVGRLDAGIELIRRAIAIDPAIAEYHSNLSVALRQKGQLDEAISSCREALRLQGDYADAHYNLSVALFDKKRFEESIAATRHVLRLKPDLAEAHNNLGDALYLTGQIDQAVAAYEQAIRLKPGLSDTRLKLGNIYRETDRLDDAIAAYSGAIQSRPDWAEAHNDLANVLGEKGQIDEAIAACRQAIRLKPDFVGAHLNLAGKLLLQGNFQQGWPEYEWRWRAEDSQLLGRKLAQPQWDGRELKGQTILIHAEQGIGDFIQFVRYVPLVARRGGRVLLFCSRDVIPLLKHFPDIAQVLTGSPLPKFDTHCPLVSLPLAFQTRLDSIPASIPYLNPDPARVETWQQKLGPAGGELRVSLTWAGNPVFKGDRTRSLTLERLAPLGAMRDVRFYALQRGPAAEQAKSPPPGLELANLGPELNDIGDTAAVMSLMDLIITTDTSVPHLAGALGRPVWLMLQFAPDFRWLLEREDSPWYPTMRLFRQKSPGDWNGVIGRVAEALGAYRV
ncbi:MAG: tetratricopeptide repeat protein [Tepidisphaeraceae bacterium]|jgi:tetratricopeptide (TPR) repeat protein